MKQILILATVGVAACAPPPVRFSALTVRQPMLLNDPARVINRPVSPAGRYSGEISRYVSQGFCDQYGCVPGSSGRRDTIERAASTALQGQPTRAIVDVRLRVWTFRMLWNYDMAIQASGTVIDVGTDGPPR